MTKQHNEINRLNTLKRQEKKEEKQTSKQTKTFSCVYVLFSNFNVWVDWNGGGVCCKETEQNDPRGGLLLMQGSHSNNEDESNCKWIYWSGPALMVPALILHQAKHSIPLIFICHVICVRVCVSFVVILLTSHQAFRLKTALHLKNKEGWTSGAIFFVSSTCKVVKYNPGRAIRVINQWVWT